MTIEQKLQMMLGEKDFLIASLFIEIEKLKEELAKRPERDENVVQFKETK